MGGTLVLNASYEVLTSVSWQRAISLVLTGHAEVHEADETQLVRSQHLSLPMPRVIRLVRYVYVKFVPKRFSGGFATKKGVLERDKHTCAYCGAKNAKTIDHILPRSRGGKDTWENLVACCAPCNNTKDNRTPEEAGMRLLWQPRCPDPDAAVQREIWAGLVPA